MLQLIIRTMDNPSFQKKGENSHIQSGEISSQMYIPLSQKVQREVLSKLTEVVCG